MTVLTRHIEAGILEDPSLPPPEDMWTLTVDPQAAVDKAVDVVIRFEMGVPVKLQAGDKVYTDSLELFVALNAIGKAAGIGRVDIVEVRGTSQRVSLKLTDIKEPLYRTEKSRLLRRARHDYSSPGSS